MAIILRVVLPAFASAADPRFDSDRRLDVEVHDFGFWIADPSLASINAHANFGNQLPGIINSQRNRERAVAGDTISPMNIVTFHGRPDGPLDIDLRVALGRFLAHWPPADVKTGRLRWLDAELHAPTDQTPLPYVAAEHWFHSARRLGDLQIKRNARQDAVLVYDAEVTITGPFPLKLDNIEGKYTLTNLGKHALNDLFISVPEGDHSRLIWLDQVDGDPTASKPAAADAAKAADGAPLSANVDALAAQPAVQVPAGGVVAAVKLAPALPAGPVAVAASTPAEPTASDQAAAAPSPNPTAPAGKQVGIDLSEAMPRSDSTFIEKTAAEWKIRLCKSGLTGGEADFLVARYAKAVFESKNVVVLYRVTPAELEEKLPLAIEPEPRKAVRSVWVFVRNLDPQIRADLDVLIAKLGSRSFSDREQAEDQLLSMGRMSIESLKQAQKHADPEVVFRVKRILKAAGEQVTDD